MTFYLENISAVVANIGLTLGLVGLGGGVGGHNSSQEQDGDMLQDTFFGQNSMVARLHAAIPTGRHSDP